MATYLISKDFYSTLQNFNTIQQCEDWVLNTLGDGYTITISEEQIPPITPEQKLEGDLQFGQQLIKEFLLDNRLITPTVTPSESLQLLSEFNNIEKLANLGDIRSVQLLLSNITTDNRLFTQERKDKYLSLINGYLQN